MPYIELNDLLSKIPMSFLIEALDDDNDGVVDDEVWTALQKEVEDEINGILEQRFELPLANPPRLIIQAARVFAMDAIYRRRGYGTSEDNPWIGPAAKFWNKLSAIAKSEEPLKPGKRNDKPHTVQIISEPSRTTSRNGNLST